MRSKIQRIVIGLIAFAYLLLYTLAEMTQDSAALRALAPIGE